MKKLKKYIVKFYIIYIMNISKTDFKILYNTISPLSQNELSTLVANINQNTTSNPVINSMMNKYSVDDISYVINKISTKILFGGNNKTNILSTLAASIESNDLTKYGYKF